MNFDPTTATDAYINGLGEETLALAAAYTAGNHWILLWGILVPIIVTAILVRTRLLERIAHNLRSPMCILWLFCPRCCIQPIFLVIAQPAPHSKGYTPIFQNGSIAPVYILLWVDC